MNAHKVSCIDAVLLDLDGVLYIGDQLIPGAVQAVAEIRKLGLPVAGVTNTTTQPRAAVAKKLADFGIDIPKRSVFTPAALAVQAIGARTATLFVRDSLLEDFAGITIASEKPDCIVMGDLGDRGYTPDILHRIFNAIMDGAALLALHKNRFWQKPDGLHLDIGPFVAAVEYATGKQARVLGKPSGDFFHSICAALNTRPETTLMVGDDIESDIGGAQAAGLATALVKTGKYREAFVKASGIRADFELSSIADLHEALDRL